MDHDHSPSGIRARLSKAPDPSYLRDWVYGGIDGAVTTFAIVAGVVGADLSARVILVLGVANLLADGFSMAAGNYSGTKAEVDERAQLAATEDLHIRLYPDGEREEVRQILKRQGLTGDTLSEAVQSVTADRAKWIDLMLREEYGVPATCRNPVRAAFATFAAFIACGVVPLVPFMLSAPAPFLSASVMTAGVFFTIGSLKSRWSLTPWWKSGSETLLIGSVAAGVAYAIGALLETVV